MKRELPLYMVPSSSSFETSFRGRRTASSTGLCCARSWPREPATTIAAFGSIDGQLAVGGMPLDRLAERVGSTPFFAYDRRLLTERVALLRATLPPASSSATR